MIVRVMRIGFKMLETIAKKASSLAAHTYYA
jgi:hypothetical protein